jgi:hypothetical protein
MKDSLARLGIKRGSLLAFALAFAMMPLPIFSGNPTGLLLVHNHAARYFKALGVDFDNHRIASIRRDESIILQTDKANQIQTQRLQLMLLEQRLYNIANSSLSVEEKNDQSRRIEHRIDRLYDSLDRDGIKYDEIRSGTNLLMIAEYTIKKQ